MKYDLVTELYLKRRELMDMIVRTQARLQNAAVGYLDISRKGNLVSFYWNQKKKGGEQRKYLKTSSDIDLIKNLAQKSYDQKLLTASKKQLKTIEKFLQDYDATGLKQIYTSMPEERKKLIKAEVLDDAAFAKQWEAVQYAPGEFDENAPEYFTMKGERVRSKTELLIANILYSLGIPYRYEYPVKLADGKIWRPDFIVLNVRTRQEFILEHFGMMDDPEYCSLALGKVQIYMKNQIYPGEQLLISAESKGRPFSNREFEAMAKHYFL